MYGTATPTKAAANSSKKSFNTLTHATPRTPLVSTNAATIAKEITMAGVRWIPPKLWTWHHRGSREFWRDPSHPGHGDLLRNCGRFCTHQRGAGGGVGRLVEGVFTAV